NAEPIGSAPPTSAKTQRQSDGDAESTTHRSPTHHSPAPLHNVHNENAPEFAATANQPCTCVVQARIQKNSPGVCITATTDTQPPNISTAHLSETCPPIPAAT